MMQVQEETIIEEEIITHSNVGATFSVPEGDSSLFSLGDEFDERFGASVGQTHGGGLYPELPPNSHDDTFGL
jgi:hypothetical protein